jgi:hypothetical protein
MKCYEITLVATVEAESLDDAEAYVMENTTILTDERDADLRIYENNNVRHYFLDQNTRSFLIDITIVIGILILLTMLIYKSTCMCM